MGSASGQLTEELVRRQNDLLAVLLEQPAVVEEVEEDGFPVRDQPRPVLQVEFFGRQQFGRIHAIY